MSLLTSSAIWWIFCSVSTRLASARAVRSAALRSRQVGFRPARADCFDLLNKPMIPSFRSSIPDRRLAAGGELPVPGLSMSGPPVTQISVR